MCFFPCLKLIQPSECLYLWRVSIDSLEVACGAVNEQAWLDESEYSRYSSITVPKGRRQFLYGRILMKHLLGYFLNISAKKVTIETASLGKPLQRYDKTLDFNLSHSGSEYVFCISTKGIVGVDIEIFRPRKNMVLLLDAIGSPQERREFLAISKKERLGYFYKIWTLKEATLKAVGSGFHLPVTSFGFSDDLTPHLWNEAFGDQQYWQWWMLPESHACCSIARLITTPRRGISRY